MESPWSCSQCTFLHKYPAQRCTMCSALRVTKKQMRDFVAGGPNNNNNTAQQQSSNDTQSSVCTNNFTHNANNISGSVSASGGGLPQNNYQSKINSQQHQQQSKSSSSTTTRNGLATATTKAINPYNTAAKQQKPSDTAKLTRVANPYASSAKSSMSNSTPHNRQQQQSNVVRTTTTNNNGNYNLLPITRTPPQQPAVGDANRGIVNNPYHNGTSLQSVAKIVGNNSNCNNPYTSARGTQVGMNVGNLNGDNEKESSHSFIQQTATNPMLNQKQQQQQQHHNQKQQQQSSSSITYRNGTFVKEKQYQAGPIPICENTKHNWIYPINTLFPERTYQLQMSYTSIMSNTLVSLPTGLGKTLVAAVVMYNYYRWFPQGKVVFIAPTRPLVSQQILACYKIMGIPEVHTAEISGRSKPDSRVAMWTNKRCFFATPQTLVKDIQENRCNPRNIVCVVMDEAHRATGSHANTTLVQLINNSGAKYRFVGLSATPGADIKSIQCLIDTLNICRIEARTEDDPNVKKYIHHREEEVIIVKQPNVVKELDNKLSQLILPILERLRSETKNVNMNPSIQQRLFYDSANIKPFSVMQVQQEYVKCSGGDHRLDGQFNILRDLANARCMLKEQGVQMSRMKLAESTHKHYMHYMKDTPVFQSLMRDMMIVASGVSQQEEDNLDTFENNPKLSKLVDVLTEHFQRKKAIGQSTRVIVFSQWRESVGGIVKMLQIHNSEMIKPAQFIGQASKKAVGSGKSKKNKNNKKGSAPSTSNYNTGQDQMGMNQAQQQRVLQQFNQGIYNVLVCTCVGEEGLDIKDVDLIVNFDTQKSAIRSIQRNGRTGRARNGRVVQLLAEHEEKNYRLSITNKNKINRALKDPTVFKLRQNAPMFEDEPNLLRKKMNVDSFHLSQVGGHTPKSKRNGQRGASRRRQGGQGKVIDNNWRLDSVQEEERNNLFGRLPPSSCRDYESKSNIFPISFKRRYLNSRSQSSIYNKMLTKGSVQKKISLSSSGRSLRIVKQLEELHLAIEEETQGVRSPSKEISTKNSKSIKEIVELIDSDINDCQSVDFGSDNDVGTKSNPKTNIKPSTLDEIFGPIRDEMAPNYTSNISNLFDAAHHKSCSVAAPPGMEIDDTDDDGQSDISASSTLSDDMSINDDLCAFFDNNKDNTCSDARVGQRQKSQVVEMKTPRFDHDVDGDDFGTAGNHQDIDFDSIQDTGKSLESSLVIADGGNQLESLHNTDTLSPKQAEEASIGLAGEKENVNSQLSLSPLRESNQDNNLLVGRQLSQQLQEEPAEDTDKQYAGDDRKVSSTGNVTDNNNKNNNSPISTSFRLPTPPPSSDDDSEDECSNEESAPQNNPFHGKDEDEPSHFDNDDNAASAFLHLPTQDSSSSDDYDIEEEENDSVDKSDIAAKPNKKPHADITILDTSQRPEETDNPIESTATSQYNQECLNFSLQDQHFVRNPECRHVHFEQSAMKDLTDTPIKSSIPQKLERMSLESLIDTPLKPCHNSSQQPRKSFDSLTDTPHQRDTKALPQRKRLRPAQNNDNTMASPEDVALPKKDRLRQRFEDKYKCQFLDCEAANDDSEDSDEEAALLREIEDEETGHDSFINDTSQLGYSQDDLDRANADDDVEICGEAEDNIHRQFNHQHEIDNQWKTPVFNRRLQEPTSQSQHTQSSQKGLGRMNFIRSVLEHHRAGGDANQLEDAYHKLASEDNTQASMVESKVAPINADAADPPINRPVTLTADQRAMIEAKRKEALQRRQQRMKQQSDLNPYKKY